MGNESLLRDKPVWKASSDSLPIYNFKNGEIQYAANSDHDSCHLFAGMGAGLGTGFAGMSAAAVISPMLITFWIWNPIWPWVSPFPRTYWPAPSPPIPMEKQKSGRQKRSDHDAYRNAVYCGGKLAVQSGSLSQAMGSFSVFMTFLLGVKFIVRPVMTTKEDMSKASPPSGRCKACCAVSSSA